MAVGRSRTRNLRVQNTGSYLWFGHRFYNTASEGLLESMSDVVGNPEGDNPLQHEKTIQTYFYLNGGASQYESWPTVTAHISLPSPDVLFGSMTNSRLQSYAWQIMARTNPSNSHVSVPTFLAELKDWGSFPRMLKELGGRLHRQAAFWNLTAQFAVVPTVSDVLKLLDMTLTVERRMADLEKLRQQGTVAKSVRFDSDSFTDSKENVLLSSASTWKGYGRWDLQAFTETWGSVRYSLDTSQWDYSNMGYAERYKYVRNLLLGLNRWAAVETAWELIPWSWLIDWFSSFGRSIKALNNTIPVNWSTVCVMRRTSMRRQSYFTTPVPPGSTLSGAQVHSVEKRERYLVGAWNPFALNVPAVTPAQWSILGSLAILKSGIYNDMKHTSIDRLFRI